jgi:hypothetical protein
MRNNHRSLACRADYSTRQKRKPRACVRARAIALRHPLNGLSETAPATSPYRARPSGRLGPFGPFSSRRPRKTLVSHYNPSPHRPSPAYFPSPPQIGEVCPRRPRYRVTASILNRRKYCTKMPTLNWIGKDAVVIHHHHVPFHLLKDVPELNCGFRYCELGEPPETRRPESNLLRRMPLKPRTPPTRKHRRPPNPTRDQGVMTQTERKSGTDTSEANAVSGDVSVPDFRGLGTDTSEANAVSGDVSVTCLSQNFSVQSVDGLEITICDLKLVSPYKYGCCKDAVTNRDHLRGKLLRSQPPRNGLL